MSIIDMHMVISIITSVGIIMIFIGIFFFGYASSIEQEIVTINTNIITSDIMNVINPLLDYNTKQNIITNIKYPDMKKEDEEVVNSNNDLIKNAMMYLIIILIISMVIGYGLAYYYKYKFTNIILLNLIILIFVGLTELIFLHLLPKKFISVDTNFIRYTFLTKMKEKFNI